MEEAQRQQRLQTESEQVRAKERVTFKKKLDVAEQEALVRKANLDEMKARFEPPPPLT